MAHATQLFQDAVLVQTEQMTFTIKNSASESFGLAVNALRKVCNISEDGLGYKAGIRLGDVMVKFNGAAVESEESLFEALRSLADGDDATFIVERNQTKATPVNAL